MADKLGGDIFGGSSSSSSTTTGYPVNPDVIGLSTQELADLLGYSMAPNPAYTAAPAYIKPGDEGWLQAWMKGQPVTGQPAPAAPGADKYIFTRTGEDLMTKSIADAIAFQRQAAQIASGMAAGKEGEAYYDRMVRKWKEAFLPSLSAKGLYTSGPGTSIEMQGLGDLAIESQRQGVQLLSDAARGLAALEAMPAEWRAKIVAAILGQSTTTSGTSESSSETGMFGPISPTIPIR